MIIQIVEKEAGIKFSVKLFVSCVDLCLFGEKISPIEVDAVLLSHPDVAQAVAFGVPDAKYGEEINCAIIPREGSNIDEEEVLRFSKKNLASFKVPKKVYITDSFPKTATGKILRRLVAEHYVSQN
ncbi:hypothetical protein TanjilG_20129 [Lupinus angustifolius]|uniref:AMP-binding enzyme C-terminal domain-containing protein n=1 Tax=Lupinus angustifolius TaxID=3871 RepID=A0A4P1RCK4_LUPAN|nr:hypothetical protein TanjilG_20129 [Lupinus angustifolius]